MEITIAIVGLGYVGLPLAVAFGKQLKTIGFDLNEEKLVSYRAAVDRLLRPELAGAWLLPLARPVLGRYAVETNAPAALC